ncbi:hypothetical protein Halsa_0216 [Halanaerobium hydrogeniformans]|uniref:Uncharacterized protein n=1 Tax=Halanaerobium hydrogeniformans TaxID=656519 RepID=E4RP13_HALHG|nr:hypothetical protein Halsa_0216 [Halanaerobium hydrogeniformans]
MTVQPENSEKYVKRVLNMLLKQYVLNWLGESQYRSTFKLSEAINFCGQHKMELIKYHVDSLLEEEENLEYVHETIMDFKEFKDLLNFLGSHKYDTPESTLLEILRNHEQITIVEHKENDRFKYYIGD